MDKKQEFLLFVKNLDYTYAQFCIWKNMKNSDYNFIYNKNLYFWIAVFDSLLFSSLIDLAKSVENIEKKNSNRKNKVLSIFYFLEKKSRFNNRANIIIEKIIKLRNKNLAHYKRKIFSNSNKFTKEVNLKYGDIEYLFDELIKIINEIKIKYDDITDYQKYFKEIKTNSNKESLNIIKCLKKEIK